MAIARRDMAIRSPAVSSRSSSRALGIGVSSWAIARSSSVLLPMAETTTTTSWPSFLACRTRSETARIRSASATDVPPYFWTMIDTDPSLGHSSVPAAVDIFGQMPRGTAPFGPEYLSQITVLGPARGPREEESPCHAWLPYVFEHPWA